MGVVTGEAGESSAGLEAAACGEADGLEANRSGIVKGGNGAVAFGAKLHGLRRREARTANDVRRRTGFRVKGAGPMAAFAGYSGLHLCQIGAGFDGGGVTSKATSHRRSVLRNAEGLGWSGRWRARMTECARSVAGLAVPGDAVLEILRAVAANRSDGLRASPEGPLKDYVNASLSLRDRREDAGRHWGVGILNAGALAQGPRVEERGEIGPGGGSKGADVARDGLSGELPRVATGAGFCPNELGLCSGRE
jgi:hypothetical protein